MKAIVTLVLFIVLVVILIRFTYGPLVTSDFARDAPRFHVLGINDGEYKMMLLSDVSGAMENIQFHLDQEEIRIDIGDIHSVRVLEEYRGTQKIGFFYSNSHISESIYEVSNNKITPISYQIKGSIGHGGPYLLVLLISAIAAPILSRLLFRQVAKIRTLNTNNRFNASK